MKNQAIRSIWHRSLSLLSPSAFLFCAHLFFKISSFFRSSSVISVSGVFDAFLLPLSFPNPSDPRSAVLWFTTSNLASSSSATVKSDRGQFPNPD